MHFNLTKAGYREVVIDPEATFVAQSRASHGIEYAITNVKPAADEPGIMTRKGLTEAITRELGKGRLFAKVPSNAPYEQSPIVVWPPVPSTDAVTSLFEPDDKAVLFDFDTTANLYQNPPATIAPAVGNPVGALMDVSRGLEVGNQLISNGAGDTTTGWSSLFYNTNIASVGGELQCTIAAGQLVARAATPISVSIGKTYRISAKVRCGAGTSISAIKVSTAATLDGAALTTDGNALTTHITVTGLFVASATTMYAGLHAQGSSGGVAYFDDITIQEIKGTHAFQSTTANMPTLRVTPETGRYWLESIDTARSLNLTTPEPYGTMYVGRVTPEGMVWSTENWSTTTVNVLGGAGSYSAGYVARGREFTAAEKALIAAYFARQMPNVGPELVINGDYSAGTANWSSSPTGVTIAVVNGELEVTAPDGGSVPVALQALPSRTYPALMVKGRIRRGSSANSAMLRIRNGVAGTIPFTATNASQEMQKQLRVAANVVDPYVFVGINTVNASAGTAYGDDISVREIL